MAAGSMKPIIFLAYANERDSRVAYLRNLPEEARRIQEALKRVSSAGPCEVVERRNATLKDILDVFQDLDKRNRVAIFHYAGHANGYELLLESETNQSEATQLLASNAAGLAATLGQQTGIQLVFLNECPTQQQAQGLLDAHLRAVIAHKSLIANVVLTSKRAMSPRWAASMICSPQNALDQLPTQLKTIRSSSIDPRENLRAGLSTDKPKHAI